MARKITKKQKRNKKKQLAARAASTRQQKQNKESKKLSQSEPSSPGFIEPQYHYIGCPNKYIGKEEYEYMVSDGGYVAGIEAAIYPATESFRNFMSRRQKLQGRDSLSFDCVDWIVVELQNMMPVATFGNLDAAKQYIFDNYPRVKSIRLDSLGIVSGDIEFTSCPDLVSSSKKQWIDFALEAQNKYGYRFDPDDAIEHIILEMIKCHGAPQVIHDKFFNRGDISFAKNYISEHKLQGAIVGLDLLETFMDEYSLLRSSATSTSFNLNDIEKPQSGEVYQSINGSKLYIENVWADEDCDFYSVDFVQFEDRNDMTASSDSLDGKQWESFVQSSRLSLIGHT